LLKRDDISVLLLAAIIFIVGLIYSNCSISAIGLALDISGVLLLWRFGLPSDLKIDGEVVGTRWDVEIDHKENQRYLFAKSISNLALVLIVVGFALQYLGSIFSAQP
jgi:hypothetical protein